MNIKNQIYAMDYSNARKTRYYFVKPLVKIDLGKY